MAKRSRMSILKRQRELRKAEKAAQKTARRHGLPPVDRFVEPKPTVVLSETGVSKPASDQIDADVGERAKEKPE